MGRKARSNLAQGETDGLPADLSAVAVAHFQDGNRLAQLGRYAEAAAAYRRAIVVSPSYAQALGNLGNALAILGKLDEAVEAWREAVAADPLYALPRSNLGIGLAQLGRVDEAIMHLRCALDLEPNFVDAHDA